MKATSRAIPRRSAARSGFTLLELVAVIGIIAIMAIVVVGGFNGIVRAISRDTGVCVSGMNHESVCGARFDLQTRTDGFLQTVYDLLGIHLSTTWIGLPSLY